MKTLTTPAEIVEELGGRLAVARLLGLKSPQPISNWVGVTRGKFPRYTAFPMLTALQAKDCSAPLELWGLPENLGTATVKAQTKRDATKSGSKRSTNSTRHNSHATSTEDVAK